jgi:S1-C subfamily serine protease/Tfp pilus assembly protein PilF
VPAKWSQIEPCKRAHVGIARAGKALALWLVLAPWVSSVLRAQAAREVAQRASPSVVVIVAEDANGRRVALATGFFVREGVVATNLHVIQGAAKGYVRLVGAETKYDVAGVVAADRVRDLVLLAVPTARASPLPLADSHRVAIGDEVYVVGNPEGLEGTISQGIVSGIRQFERKTLIQITAPISPGSSGGPVLDGRAEVIGVAVASLKQGQNLNFAVPASYLISLLAESHAASPLRAEEPATPPRAKQGGRPAPEEAPQGSSDASIRGRVNRCNQLSMSGPFVQAEQACREALRGPLMVANGRFDFTASVHAWLGRSLQNEDKLDGAVAELEEAIQLEPTNSDFHHILGEILADKGDLDGAIGEYQAALSLYPVGDLPPDYPEFLRKFQKHELASIHSDLGIALFSKGDKDASVGELQEAVRLAPAVAVFHSWLGIALESRGRIAAACDEYRTALELDASDGTDRKSYERLCAGGKRR